MQGKDKIAPRGALAMVAVVCSLVGASMAAGAATPAQRDELPWESMQQDTFDVRAGGTLEVDVDDADVAIASTSEQRAEVEIRLRSNDMEWARERFESMNYRTRLDGNKVVVESDRVRNNRGWQRNRWMSVVVDVRVPSRFDLDIRSNDGDVTLGSHEGAMQIVTQDGDIGADSLNGSSIDLRSQDGDVLVASVEGDSIDISSQDGDIEIDTLAGAARVRTADGDIHIASANSEELTLESSDGDVFVGLAGSARLDARTSDGDISIAAPSSLRADIDLAGGSVSMRGSFNFNGRASRRRTQGSINGGGAEIRARTSDGAIRLIEQRDQ